MAYFCAINNTSLVTITLYHNCLVIVIFNWTHLLVSKWNAQPKKISASYMYLLIFLYYRGVRVVGMGKTMPKKIPTLPFSCKSPHPPPPHRPARRACCPTGPPRRKGHPPHSPPPLILPPHKAKAEVLRLRSPPQPHQQPLHPLVAAACPTLRRCSSLRPQTV